MTLRHFLTLNDLTRDELETLIARASEMKNERKIGKRDPIFAGRVLVMMFYKSSTRTRVSFETAMAQGGGHAIFLHPRDSQIGRGEPLADTARVLSEMADAIMVRTYGHDELEAFAQAASVPVINGLTDTHHPCQLLADLQTYYEHRGPIAGRTVVWVGDGNNMCNSYIEAAGMLDFELRVACPPGYEPELERSGKVSVVHDPMMAAEDADLVVTDVWASMGQEHEQDDRAELFAPYIVNAELMSRARSDALFMHCLPAHRGEEVTAEVIDAPDSVVWDEAGNRLHAQKALLEFLLNRKG
ncbi:MAG: ornithine carbamoyltransferase [Gammaproteobacteria bacterium]|nr:ornithine carbamoyltransferase [Gammaproteobacteria bacterium]